MKKLSVSFLNELGKKQTWSLKEPHQELAPEVVKEQLEAFVALNLFEKNGIKLYQEVTGAKYVEVIETELF